MKIGERASAFLVSGDNGGDLGVSGLVDRRHKSFLRYPTRTDHSVAHFLGHMIFLCEPGKS